MIAKKSAARRRIRKRSSSNGKPAHWRETLERRLRKVAEIEALFVVPTKGLVHVFTVIAEHDSDIYDSLMKQERRVEKDHPSIAFDFHTREHQGRPPHRAVPHGAELVFLRS